MRKKFVLFKRGHTYYAEDVVRHRRVSLQTKDRHEAERLLHAKNEALAQPTMNMAMARTYLTASDPKFIERTWGVVMEEFVKRSVKDSTKLRRERAMRSPPFLLLHHKKIIETTADELRGVLRAGGVFTNHFLRCLHNLAQGLGWLPWPIIPSKLWPLAESKPKRGISEEEHGKIIRGESNPERKLYYQLLWETGAAQSDGAGLKAENIDWKNKILTYQRQKSGEWCHLRVGAALESLLRQLPAQGPLLPRISQLPERWRSAEFRRRCRILGIGGVSLHSYRYAWAQRAYSKGVPERFAQAALGHSSKAVHHAYAKKAHVICPPMEEYEKTELPRQDFEQLKAG